MRPQPWVPGIENRQEMSELDEKLELMWFRVVFFVNHAKSYGFVLFCGRLTFLIVFMTRL